MIEEFIIKEKFCSKCKTSKPLDDFHKNTKSPDGRKSQCKVCRNDYNRNHKVKDRITLIIPKTENFEMTIVGGGGSGGKPTLVNEIFCSTCGEFLDPKEFNPKNAIDDKLSDFITNICNTCNSKSSLKHEINYPRIFIQLNNVSGEIETLLKKRKLIPYSINCTKDTRIRHYTLEVCHGANLLYIGLGYNLDEIIQRALNDIREIKNYDYDRWDNLTLSVQ